MVIYRVEHEETRLGPYVSCVTTEDHYSDNCPDPYTDGIDKYAVSDNPYFGFASKKDAYRWFGQEYLQDISKKNFSLFFYVVKEEAVSVGRQHLAFDRKRAVRIMKTSIH